MRDPGFLPRGVLLPILFVLAGSVASAAQNDPRDPAAGAGDERFIAGLGERYSGQAVDRSRLARLFFGAASTLDGDRRTLQFLQTRVSPRGPAPQIVAHTTEDRFARYSAAVARFGESAGKLLEAPESTVGLFRALMDGHRACLQLDRYLRVLETYGVAAGDLISSVSSHEACDRFRRASLQPQVEGLLIDPLVAEEIQRDEIRNLREELRELERLLEDLRELDGN